MQEPQRVALPAVLRQGLTAFRESQGDRKIYRVRDTSKGQAYQFETWQFFVLEVLPVCSDFQKLASIFEDRFGRPVTTEEVEKLFRLVEEMKLFAASADAHPLVASFYKKKGIQLVLHTAEAQAGADGETKGGGNGKGNGEGTGASAEPGTGRQVRDAGAVSSIAVVFNTADFTAQEFKTQRKDVQKLCRIIKSEGFSLEAVKAPENTIEWLNGVLQVADLCDQVAVRKSKLRLNDDITRLKEQTEKIRKGSFKDLKIDEQNMIRKMNRLLLELLYPEAPRSFAPDMEASEDGIRWKIFNPGTLLKRVHPYLSPLKYALYTVPLLGLAAFFTGIHHADLVRNDLARMGWTSAAHLVTSMLTVNLFTVLVTALTAYSFRASVNSFGIVLLFRFFPRFSVQIGHTQQLSRRERIWLSAAPLLARLGIASLGLLVWFGTRVSDGFLPHLALTVGMIGSASLLLAANPFMRSSGSRLLGAVLNEPQLRLKAYLALQNKLHGDTYVKADSAVLAAYALASSLFMLAAAGVFLLLFGNLLKLHLGGAGIFLVVIIAAMLMLRLTQKIRQVSEFRERALHFERWRNRALPTVDADRPGSDEPASAMKPVQWLIIGSVVAALFVPYHYEPGGSFVLLPKQKSELTSENGGIISMVYFDGGEYLRKGTVVAKLSTADYESMVKVFEAKISEQQSLVNDLRAKPKPEEVELAKQELDVRERQAWFSGEKLKRLEKLYNQNTISQEEYEDQRKQAEVDVEQVKESRAKLSLVRAGATDEEIAAAEAKMQSFREERDYYKGKINQAMISMPFDGVLQGINLKLKSGHFLNKGELFAEAHDTSQMFAEIEVPEPDISYVAMAARTRLRPLTYSDREFNGIVTGIDAGVTEKPSGRLVKVVTVLDNKDRRLRSGMTGHAKIGGQNIPIGKVMSRSIVRFFEVEVWSWMP